MVYPREGIVVATGKCLCYDCATERCLSIEGTTLLGQPLGSLPEVLVVEDYAIWWVLANTILQWVWICVVAYKGWRG